MRELDESPPWQGQCIYNLACYYALTGDKAEAIRNLERSRPVMLEKTNPAARVSEYVFLDVE